MDDAEKKMRVEAAETFIKLVQVLDLDGLSLLLSFAEMIASSNLNNEEEEEC